MHAIAIKQASQASHCAVRVSGKSEATSSTVVDDDSTVGVSEGPTRLAGCQVLLSVHFDDVAANALLKIKPKLGVKLKRLPATEAAGT